MSSLKLTLFGSPQVELDGERVTFKTRKALALLAYLAVSHQPHSRETLATLFWPEFSSERAFTNLRQTLWALKHHLSDQWFEIRRHEVTIKDGPGFWVDVLEFQQQLAHATGHKHAAEIACAECFPSLLAAIDLYRDDFLRGFTLPDCPAFDEWQASQTDRLREQLLDGFRNVIAYTTSRGDLTRARQYTQHWVALCPWSEAAHRELMRVYALNQQRSAALQQYQTCVQMLQDEFGAEPEHETQELYETIVHQPSPDGRGGVSPPEQGRENLAPTENISPSHNLPAQTTTFIGRETEIAAVSNLVSRADIRLLTLTGPGGSGKTRLSLQVAADLAEGFQDGVGLVPRQGC